MLEVLYAHQLYRSRFGRSVDQSEDSLCLPVDRNEQQVKDGRREYAEWFMVHASL